MANMKYNKYKLIKILLVWLIATSAIACHAQKKLYKPLKIGTMEKFDIEDFNKNKNKFSEQTVTDNSDIQVRRMWDSYDSSYNEFTTIYHEYCTIYKTFYSNGIIKERGKMYKPGGFEIGIWEYFDSTGKLIRTRDYDTTYKVNYKQALSIVAEKFGYEQKNLRIDIVGNNWFMENIKGKKHGMAATVNMNTGAATEYYPSNRIINDEAKPDSDEVKPDDTPQYYTRLEGESGEYVSIILIIVAALLIMLGIVLYLW